MDEVTFLRLLRPGGKIVSTGDLSEYEIACANACRRMFVDDDGFGYVYFPPDKREE